MLLSCCWLTERIHTKSERFLNPQEDMLMTKGRMKMVMVMMVMRQTDAEDLNPKNVMNGDDGLSKVFQRADSPQPRSLTHLKKIHIFL